MLMSDKIKNALQSLNPTYLSLENESMNHAGYFEGKESHFKLTIVSQDFLDKRPVARHQIIYQLVHDCLMANGGSVHALAIHAYTPNEWQATTNAPDSPKCAGQNKG